MSHAFLYPKPGQAAELVPMRALTEDITIPGTDCIVQHRKYLAGSSVNIALGEPVGLATTQTGDENTLADAKGAVTADFSASALARFAGVALNSCPITTGGFGCVLKSGSLWKLNERFGTTIKVPVTTSTAAGTRMKWAADGKLVAVSTGADIANTVAVVTVATSSAQSTENIIIGAVAH